MALSQEIFHPDFAFHHRPTVKSGMLARVRIDRVTAEGKYNLTTGLMEGEVKEILYIGKARIDKVARPTRRDFVFDSADNQVVEVQIPLELEENEADPATAPVFRSNDRVTVLENASNPTMVNDKYFVHGDAGSSNDWLQTLVCRYNAKQGT